MNRENLSMRNTSFGFLVAALAIAGCAQDVDPSLSVQVIDDMVVEGNVPAGVDVRQHFENVPPGGFGVIADPGTGEVATIYAAASPFARNASGEFSVAASATCPDCIDPTCGSSLRTIDITLTQDTGPNGETYRAFPSSSQNFSSPTSTPASWTSAVGVDQAISTTGTLPACAPFTYYFDVVDVTNLALAGTASQSSTYTGAPFPGPASFGNDGNTNGAYGNASVAHTLSENGAWFEVDLGSVRDITNVVVWNRTDGCCVTRMNNYNVFVSDVPFPGGTPAASRTATIADPVTYSRILTAAAPTPSATHAFNRTGRFVRVQLQGTNFLQVAELQVFGH